VTTATFASRILRPPRDTGGALDELDPRLVERVGDEVWEVVLRGDDEPLARAGGRDGVADGLERRAPAARDQEQPDAASSRMAIIRSSRRRTFGSWVARRCIAGSINGNERTASGLRLAASSATQPPKECSTR
jgi:hypothetical protein